MMRTVIVTLFLVCVCWDSAYGFGHITSRFRPEPGYGTWGSQIAYRNAFPQRISSPREQLLEALLMEEEQEEEQCSGRPCTANEHCCLEHICMAFSARTQGVCMAVGSSRSGDECSSDDDCPDGGSCDLGVCSEPKGDKTIGEDCTSSTECDGSRNLCCQLIRRHRQAPRKMCTYYRDPRSCMGKVIPNLPQKRAHPGH